VDGQNAKVALLHARRLRAFIRAGHFRTASANCFATGWMLGELLIAAVKKTPRLGCAEPGASELLVVGVGHGAPSWVPVAPIVRHRDSG
jgi:hypothetical protein